MAKPAEFQDHIDLVKAKHFPMDLGSGTSCVLSDRPAVQALYDQFASAVFPERDVRSQFVLP